MADADQEKLQERIGYRFAEPALLAAALTHRSYANEQPAGGRADNERLEFLGDAILGLVIAEALYRDYPQLPEGELTRLRAELVNAATLAQLARQLELGTALRLGRGEVKGGGRDKENILADALEALFGAIYLEAGSAAARPAILGLFGPTIAQRTARRQGSDYKTRLQEELQARRRELPDYSLIASQGPDHDRSFDVEVRSAGQLLGSGSGRSKKEAEQAAAKAALEGLPS